MTKEESIARSKEKVRLRKLKQKTEKEYQKTGVAYIHKNRIPIAERAFWNYPDVVLTIAVERLEPDALDAGVRPSFLFSYAICSEKDDFSMRIAKGLLGNRLLNKENGFTFLLQSEREDLSDRELLHLGQTWLQMAALNKDSHLPDCLIRAFLANLDSSALSISSLKK